ncbi:MAG: molecular chaperone Hsp90 [[Clostridium] leptum]
MEKEKLEFVKGKTQELLQSQTCCAEGKAAAKAWLEAIGTEQEAAETERYLNELKADIMPIDQLIGFAGSEAGIQYFGEAAAKGIVSHAEEIKVLNGARYCGWLQCAAAEAVPQKAGDAVGMHQSSSSVLFLRAKNGCPNFRTAVF